MPAFIRYPWPTVSAVAILLSAVAMASVPCQGAWAFTERQVDAVFSILDSAKTGKVDRSEYEQNKVAAMFPQAKLGASGIGTYRYEDTPFNRAFFAAADQDHKGYLDAVDLIYAFEFDKIDVAHKGYITLDDLRRFMNKIGR